MEDALTHQRALRHKRRSASRPTQAELLAQLIESNAQLVGQIAQLVGAQETTQSRLAQLEQIVSDLGPAAPTAERSTSCDAGALENSGELSELPPEAAELAEESSETGESEGSDSGESFETDESGDSDSGELSSEDEVALARLLAQYPRSAESTDSRLRALPPLAFDAAAPDLDLSLVQSYLKNYAGTFAEHQARIGFAVAGDRVRFLAFTD